MKRTNQRRPKGRRWFVGVGDGVPTSRQRGSAAPENGFPRQCEHWLGMTGKRGGDSTALSCSYAELSLPLFFFQLRMKGISRFLNRRSFAVTP